MLRIALIAALMTSPALAEECFYVSGDKELHFVSPALVAVADRTYKPPYACYTSSAGTGVDGRMLGCSDGFDGPLIFTSDTTITFRDSEWDKVCVVDNSPMDIGYGN